jgi:uncharacterized protein YchJ
MPNKGHPIVRNARPIKLTALLLALLALSGCFLQRARQPAPEDVAALMAARAEAVNAADQEAYLATVLPSDDALMKEEANLIRSAAGLGIADYEAAAGEPVRTDSGFTAAVTQRYTLGGQVHECAYTASYVWENGRLYYGGPDFLTVQNDRVKVCYTPENAGIARRTLEAETAVLDDMESQLGFAPQGLMTVKIYDDARVFRQSVKLDLPAWVGGWQEYGEAIKSYVGAYPSGDDLRGMLNHETTHRMISELSNDNASYWIQEGLASVFQVTLGNPRQALLTPDEAEEQFTPYSRQKSLNLETLEGADAGLYYATSKAFAAFLLDRYGWEKVRQALEYMKKYPLLPVTGAEKISETNERTDEAVRYVFGFDSDGEFQKAFDEWLEDFKFNTL